MGAPETVHCHLVFTRDPETASVVAEVPALQIANFGADVSEALEHLLLRRLFPKTAMEAL